MEPVPQEGKPFPVCSSTFLEYFSCTPMYCFSYHRTAHPRSSHKVSNCLINPSLTGSGSKRRRRKGHIQLISSIGIGRIRPAWIWSASCLLCLGTFPCIWLADPIMLNEYVSWSSIRNRLTALKKDRGDFIKTTDVLALYQQIVKQGEKWIYRYCTGYWPWSLVTRLNDVREEQPPHKNRVDTTLSDVFSLLSLFFLTIGKTKECPATYCQISTIRVNSIFLEFPVAFLTVLISNCWITWTNQRYTTSQILPPLASE